MKMVGAALTGLCVSVATALLSLASAGALDRTRGDDSPITCSAKGHQSARVSQPNTSVTVTCSDTFTLDPPPGKEGSNNIYLDANCSQLGLLSSVCPGATVTKVERTKDNETTVDVFIPQLPTSQQVVCLKCKEEGNDCLAVITVAPASPRGPQVCAGRGSSVTLRINEAGGSAQFACGEGLALEPGDVKQAYADDCTTQETLKDMSRSTVTETYATFKVDKLEKKRLCYSCKPTAEGGVPKVEAKDESCKIYVEISGSTRFSSSIQSGFALPCVAAMLRFT